MKIDLKDNEQLRLAFKSFESSDFNEFYGCGTSMKLEGYGHVELYIQRIKENKHSVEWSNGTTIILKEFKQEINSTLETILKEFDKINTQIKLLIKVVYGSIHDVDSRSTRYVVATFNAFINALLPETIDCRYERIETPNYIRIEGFEFDSPYWENEMLKEELYTQLKTKNLNKESFYFAVITHSFPNTQLPIELDYAFYDKESKDSQPIEVSIRGCFNYRSKFHTELWQGYNHFAVIQIHSSDIGQISPLKDIKMAKRWDSNLILCKSKDSIQCKELLKSSRISHETFMKTRNPKIWESNKREEKEYKRKHTHNNS